MSNSRSSSCRSRWATVSAIRRVVVDEHFDGRHALLGQAAAIGRWPPRRALRLVQQHGQIHPVTMAQRVRQARRKGVVRFEPLVESPQGQKTVAVEREVLRAAAARAAGNGRPFRQVAREQAGHVEKGPRTPIGSAQQEPELVARGRVPLRSGGPARPPSRGCSLAGGAKPIRCATRRPRLGTRSSGGRLSPATR